MSKQQGLFGKLPLSRGMKLSVKRPRRKVRLVPQSLHQQDLAQLRKERAAECRESNIEVFRQRGVDRLAVIRIELFALLGNECVCCGEDYSPFLQVDHVNGDGAKHIREFGRRPFYLDFLRWEKEGDPKYAIQLLCSSCNKHKGTGHACGCQYAKDNNDGRKRNIPAPIWVG